MEGIFTKAFAYLKNGVPLALAEVTTSSGSTPRGAGANMLILPEETHFSVGGGAMEGEVIRLAREKVLIEKKDIVYSCMMDGSDMDLICGGSCTVRLTYLDPHDPTALENISTRAADEAGKKDKLILFGGGHVSRETANVALACGFDVSVVDDREEFANAERFPGCEVYVRPAFDDLPECENGAYIIIMTRGHAFDRKVLAWAINRDFHYLGMIGSLPKRETTYESLAAEGFSMDRLRSEVHCPIGLPIKAKTPAEIAVSVMAEVIKEKYRS